MPDLISVEDMCGPPERSGASISPDGTRIAYLAPWRSRLNVWVQDLDSGAEPRCVTADETRTVSRYEWTDDPRFLLYLQDDGGDENWHIHRVDLDDPQTPAVDLTPFPGAQVLGLERPAARPGTAIVQLNARTAAEFDLYELAIATGELTLLVENPGDVMGWLYAGDGQLFARTLTDEGDIALSRRDAVTGELVRVATFDGADYPLDIYPFEVTPDGTGAWIGSNRGTDRTRLVRVDLATGEETDVDAHPSFDLDTRSQVFPTLPSPLIRHRRTGELLGVRYLGEKQVIRALDPHFAEVLTNLEALSDGTLAAVSSDASRRRWVVSFTHDRDPGVTWLYDHATGESRMLFRPFPHLDPAAMAPMTPVTITARDGLTLPSYLTLPVGIEPSGLPMVLMVHGGPWTRDTWGFDRSVQLLANRGYAVLQVNFRGSAGFGKAHMQAAIGEFAGKMHDDLIDAVDWATAQGYADPERVAIFGGSYGGYATLVGVTCTPDRFAAAVEYVGVSNLANFMRTVPEHAKPGLINNWHRYVGDPADPAQEADMLARSPITRVEQIRTPLMVVQGANDVRVVQAESDNIVDSLRARGVDVEYLVFDDEGHMFVNPENLITMFRAADRFLAQHLGERDDSA
ncbi:putative peptidase [Rhodococcus wratislaviensis NBRC 100605]|uniref:Putative peptidase n=1 Tax=Rhodococcus wratislaviensis NBRC 100605 TaxID=1219028 RepID=X0Q7U5_RHOWR|nr:putative peptidase [Rhodococcus wratislaviensis NBRC 100605]